MKVPGFHKDFKINGRSFKTHSDLIEFSKNRSLELGELLSDWFSDDDVLITKTSGSTGEPKPICLSKLHIVNSVVATTDFFKIVPGSKALLCLPLTYIAGKLMVLRSLLSGWDLEIMEPTSSPLENGSDSYDFAAMVPLQLEKSISQLNRIKTLIVGGGKVSEHTIEKIQSTTCKVFETYGMTETITHIAVRSLNHVKQNPTFFETLPNVKLYKDERDCLVINAPNVSDDLIFTNDVVQLMSNREFRWKGRFDNIINSGGIKINPETIEQKLFSSINNRFFITSQPDSLLGEKLVVVVEGNKIEDVELLKLNIKGLKGLTKFEKPKKIILFSTFLETNSGKIKRKEMMNSIVPIFEIDI